MTYDCMTPEEYALWADQNSYAPCSSPCFDCPLTFRRQEFDAGRCHQPSPVPYTEDRRRYNREWMRRHRAAQASQ